MYPRRSLLALATLATLLFLLCGATQAQQCVNGVCTLRSVVSQVLPPYRVHSHYHAPVVTSRVVQYSAPVVYHTPSSTQVLIAPNTATAAEVKIASTPIEAQASISDRVKFRRAVMEAARKALKKDEIGIAEFLLVAGATRNPATLDKLMASVEEAAVEQGVGVQGQIDWEAIADFIERIVPIIIKLIELFG